MGGGDLNSKKSWHPNTMKNQERVWKAEQAAAEEKRRMVELQREHAEERDRAELNDILSKRNNASASDDRLSWMYDKPDKKVDHEAYLLGKTLEKNPEQSENAEQDPIPAVSRRVVGSSMLTAAGDTQVDMSRKLREDPLLLIKERERAARAALLNNPLQRRRLTELLRKDQEERKEKKKAKKKDKDLDVLLASKLNALGAGKGVDLAGLLDSDDSSSESDDDKSKKKKKKKHKKQKSKKKKKKHSSSDSDSDEVKEKNKVQYEENEFSKKTSEYKHSKYENKESRKRTSSDDHQRSESPVKKKYRIKDDIDSRSNYFDSSYRDNRHRNSESYRDKQYGEKETYRDKQYRDKEQHRDKQRQERELYGSKQYKDPKDKYNEEQRYSSQRKSAESVQRSRDYSQSSNKKRPTMSEEEKAAKLAEMASAGTEREVQRGVKVAKHRAAELVAEKGAPSVGRSRHDTRSLPDSLESRIHSNRHYIQRDKRQMNENFARR